MAVLESRPTLSEGLSELRRSGSVTELLFLYECATLEPPQLRPVAERLGVTVQAVSHSFRQLRKRGLVEVRDGRYRPTVPGVAWLHETLRGLGDDVRSRVERLHVIRSCRAVALTQLPAGASVSLELRNGLLSARRGGSGPSHGTTVRAARAGALVEVTNLEGIVALEPAVVRVRTIAEADLEDPGLGRRLAATLPAANELLAAEGVEAYLALRKVADRPVVRFATAAACVEAARLGVSSTLFVTERDLPRLLASFSVPNRPSLEVLALGAARRRPVLARHRRSQRVVQGRQQGR